MKKEEVGYVIDTKGEIAKIKIGRHSDCKNCGSCPGNDSLILNVKNPVGAEIGQKVYFETKGSKMLISVYIVYIQPILLVCLGVYIGYLTANNFNKPVAFYELIFGGMFFIFSLIIIGVVERRLANDKNSMPTITRIVS
ncbi:SoxR reducing system RseC family protein [Romboutsia sp.]|uniref:SoxR reducing system RseC family protein n=1 Tax=Romboutsia sp. TaxID=1965302 RepID=UPI003F3A8032